jgi:hypothetical protein
MKEQLEAALDEIGGEPLDGSGIDDEVPDPEFSGAVLLPLRRKGLGRSCRLNASIRFNIQIT